MMYSTLATRPIFLPTKSPMVTAGLMWHPETWPMVFKSCKKSIVVGIKEMIW
jgi:hypothetical protein